MNTYNLLLILSLASFALSFFLIKFLIPMLKRSAKQPIYEDGPKWHSIKYGTPTMGGIAFIGATVMVASVAALLFLPKGDISGISVFFSLAFALCNAIIGAADDLTKLRHHENAGLTPRQKLILQAIFAIFFLIGRSCIFNDGQNIYFGTFSINLGIWYYPLAMIIILGIINCANLTDGLDGLCGSVTFIILISLFCFSNIDVNINSRSMLSIIAAGAVLGFLTQNIHPARVFMGDTGSLFLGALVVAIGFDMQALPTVVVTSGIYVIEGVSVIIQVLYYKATKKRLFKMAPIHHHFEKIGREEGTICLISILATSVFALIGYALLG